MATFYPGKRLPYSKTQNYQGGQMMEPYDPLINTKGREYLNSVLYPRFAKRFKDGDTIYFIGKHGFWDYSLFFSNFELRTNFLITDNEPGMDPDIVDDIVETKLPDNSAEGVCFTGMWEIMGGAMPKILGNIYRILKPGGSVIISKDAGYQRHKADDDITFAQLLVTLNQYLIDEVHFVYGPPHTKMRSSGDIDSYLLIARKPE
jgi:SAM-dependent methyltransferase